MSRISYSRLSPAVKRQRAIPAAGITLSSAAIQFYLDVVLYGFSTFLPPIIVSMGYTGLQAQYLTIPVYGFGALFFLTSAFFSDRLRPAQSVYSRC